MVIAGDHVLGAKIQEFDNRGALVCLDERSVTLGDAMRQPYRGCPRSGRMQAKAFTSLAVRVGRQAVMRVLVNVVMRFAGLIRRIDMDHHERQIIQMMKQLMAHFGGNGMRLRDRQLRIDGDIQFGMQAMPEPARPHLGNLFDLRHILGDMANFFDDVWFGAIEHAHEDRFSALNDDAEDRGRNEQPDDGIGKRIAEPYPNRAEQHGQARPAVDAGVVPVGDQGGAVDFPADADAEDRNSFVADKAYDRCTHHRPQIRNVLRMQEPLDALVTGDDGARQNREHDGHARQVLDAAIAEA